MKNELIKPATISFGQSLRSKYIEKAFKAVYKCDIVIVMGSILSVHLALDIQPKQLKEESLI